MFALIQNGVCTGINSVGHDNAIKGDDDYVVECEGYEAFGQLHDKETGEFTGVTSTDEELAVEAQAYLGSTDYIYLSQQEKGLSDDEVAVKYADIITKRIEAREVVSAYNDSL